MALLWIDGFDNYGTSVGSAPAPTGIMGRKYPNISLESSMQIEAGRLGGYAWQGASTLAYFGTSTGLTANATMIIGLALKVKSSWSSGSVVFLRMRDGVTNGMSLYLTSTGEIEVRLGSTLIATTSGAGLTLGAWSYIEFKVTCNTYGSYELRVGGVNMLSDPNVNTKAGTHDCHDNFLINGTDGQDAKGAVIDDLYCCDGSGSLNNDFLGNRRVISIYPDGDDTIEFATTTNANHYLTVNEVIMDEDTSYVEDLTVGNADIFTYSDVNSIGGIVGIQINTDCRETDATSFDLVTSVISGNVNSDDAGQAIGSSSFVTRRRILETDPNTNVAWELADLNSAKIGFKVG